MPVEKLKNFLDERRVKHVSIYRLSAYTAQEIAEASHVPGKEMAKTVMVKPDGDLAMVVVPPSRQVNFQRLREAIGANAAVLATEDEFRDRFPGCELGAIPPFGNLYGLPVFVSRALTEDKGDKEIASVFPFSVGYGIGTFSGGGGGRNSPSPLACFS
jgi:Ala-tRNA(Pro) deacylase